MTAVRGRFVFVAMLVMLAGATAVPAQAASPTVPANRPNPIPGAVNGEVSRSQLVSVTPQCSTARGAGPSLMRLFTMARQAGVPLAAEQCYRGLREQVDLARRANQ